MSTIHERVGGAAAKAGDALRRAVRWHGPGGRVRMIASAATATVLAVGAGIWWGIAGAEEPLEPAGAAPPVATASSGPFGDAPAGSTGSGARAGGNPAAGGDQPGGAGSGSGSGGTDTGGQAANRPPSIDDPGLSSDGLTLAVAPTVTDPDGDDVSVRVKVDGDEVPSSATDPNSGLVSFDHREVGYTHTATVEIEATDSRGATTRETFSHDLAAVTIVTLRNVTFQVLRPQECFRDERARRVTGALLFTGPVTRTFSFDEELRADRPSVQLLGEDTGEVSGREAVQGVALVGGQFAGHFDVSDDRHRPTDTASGSTIVTSMFETSGDCESRFSYRVFFRIR